MKIINIVSGKGGTGKTLLVAVLAELLSRRQIRALVIDVDIFVRGLTCLLYFQQDRAAKLLPDAIPSVADVLQGKGFLDENIIGDVRYRGFNVWPAVRRINESLDYRDVAPDNFEEAKYRVKRLLDFVREDAGRSGKGFDIVFLDSRAGFDELIASTHSLSDITINVLEEDIVATITSENLTSQLKSVPSLAPVYNITNKSRSVSRIDDTNPSNLGVIPFDADVSSSYGRPRFWNAITESLLEPSLVHVWNQLCRSETMPEFTLKSDRANLISRSLDVSFARIGSAQRIFTIYGILTGFGGLLLSFGGRDLIGQIMNDPFRFVGILMSLLGLTLAYMSVSNTIFKR